MLKTMTFLTAQAAGVLAVVLTVSWIWFGDFASCLAMLSGRSKHCFLSVASESRGREIEIRNLALTALQVQGFAASCDIAIFATGMPATIAPGKSRSFPIVGGTTAANSNLFVFIDGATEVVAFQQPSGSIPEGTPVDAPAPIESPDFQMNEVSEATTLKLVLEVDDEIGSP